MSTDYLQLADDPAPQFPTLPQMPDEATVLETADFLDERGQAEVADWLRAMVEFNTKILEIPYRQTDYSGWAE